MNISQLPTSHSPTKHSFINTKSLDISKVKTCSKQEAFSIFNPHSNVIFKIAQPYILTRTVYISPCITLYSQYLRIICIKELSINPYLPIFTVCTCAKTEENTGPAQPITGSIPSSAPGTPWHSRYLWPSIKLVTLIGTSNAARTSLQSFYSTNNQLGGLQPVSEPWLGLIWLISLQNHNLFSLHFSFDQITSKTAFVIDYINSLNTFIQGICM